jgi:DNA-binding CsgD family transcriptional regulator
MMLLLERDSFLLELHAALKDSVAGQGRVALVSGEAGIGKTSLIEHFIHSHRDSIRVLWGACDPLFTPRPLGPLQDIAMQVDGKLPELLQPGADRQDIFSACLSEFQNLPSIIVFEDVHWADEATLDLIKFLGRRIQRTSTLFILSYREDELAPTHPLHLAFGDISRAATLRLRLLPLSQSSVMILARAAKQDERVSDLYDTTGGNPFFVTEALASEGESVPATVRDAVLARAARLSPSARAVLDTAAIVPGRIEDWLLNELLSPSPAAIEECVGRGMLSTSQHSFAFRHELARRSIEDALSPSRRKGLHQQILTALMARDDQVQFSRLVHHAAFAGDGSAVLRFAPVAAEQAAAVGAHLEAAAHYQTALEYADRLTLMERAQLIEKRAYECYLTSQIHEAVEARTAALELWQKLRDTRQEGNNLRWLSRLHWFLGHRAESEQYAQHAIVLLETLQPTQELAMAYSNRAQLHMLADETAEAIQLGEQAIALAEKLGDSEVLCHALNNVGTAEQYQTYNEAGRSKLERSLKIALAHGFHEHVARAYTNLASKAVEHRQYDYAMPYLNSGIGYSIERDLDAWTTYMLAWRARAYYEQGQWIEAADDAQAVLKNPRAAVVARIPALTALGAIRLRRGDPDGEQVLDEALGLALPTGELQRIGPVALARAESNWLNGVHDECISEAQTVYTLAVNSADSRRLSESAFWIWRAGGSLLQIDIGSGPFTLQIMGDWRAAAVAWERLGCPYEQALALMDGDVLAQTQSLEIFERLGARPAARLVVQKLRAIPQRQLDKDRIGGLTARERDVVLLIAQGKSNREIAEAMTVGIKTVETYVTRILKKLNLASRVQIATWVLEKGLR